MKMEKLHQTELDSFIFNTWVVFKFLLLHLTPGHGKRYNTCGSGGVGGVGWGGVEYYLSLT